MGIKHFFIWYRRNFENCIREYNKKDIIEESVDNLCIDLNGVFHPSAQKIYEYGEYSKPKGLLMKRIKIGKKWRLNFFKDVCNTIEMYREFVKPKKRIILCVDGVAGAAKMCQQRQRRFRSVSEKNPCMDFDPTSLTPGTPLMNFLTKYIDWFIRMMKTTHPMWKDLEIVFSNEKVPGEGEHKIINYLREHGNTNESYCIQGLDADLIMLTMGTMFPKMYILRENIYSKGKYFMLHIHSFREECVKKMNWDIDISIEDGQTFHEQNCVNDFILMCFLVGNDFLPTIPTLAILEDGIDIMIDVYKEIGYKYGHLTRTRPSMKGYALRPQALIPFFKKLASYEQSLLNHKQENRRKYIPDELLNSCTKDNIVDLSAYKEVYYKKNFGDVSIETICHEYIKGLSWVINYYKVGIPDWKWYYPYFYAPFMEDIVEHLDTYKDKVFVKGEPVELLLQLLCVLPPQSAELLPHDLQTIMIQPKLRKYYPTEIEIDCSGKRKEWEGIVKLPMLNIKEMEKEYQNKINRFNPKFKHLNKFGSNFIYQYTTTPSFFQSYYGNFESNCNNKLLYF